jgi:hypothetical protein
MDILAAALWLALAYLAVAMTASLLVMVIAVVRYHLPEETSPNGATTAQHPMIR